MDTYKKIDKNINILDNIHNNLSEEELIKNILMSYPNGINSLINTEFPKKNDVYITLLLNGEDSFINKFSTTEEELQDKDSEEEDILLNLNINSSKEDIINIYNKEEIKYKSINILKEKKEKTEYYSRILNEIFKELNKTDDKLIDKIIFNYGKNISEKLKEENNEYYNLCLNEENNNNNNKIPFYYELIYEDFLLILCSILRFYTKMNMKLEVYKNKKILLYFFVEDENLYKQYASFFTYDLQLKPYALKFEEILQYNLNSQFAFIKKNKTFNQSNALNILQIKEKYKKHSFELQFEDFDIDNCIFFPPYFPFDIEKENKFRRYLKNDEFHICKDDKEFYENNLIIKEEDCNCYLFRNIDKLRLIHFNITYLLQFSTLYKSNILKTIIFKKDYYNYKGKMIWANAFNINKILKINLKLVNLMRNYFGENFSYYFLWLNYFLIWNIFLSISGIMVYFIKFNPQTYFLNFNENIVEFHKNFKLDRYDISLILFSIFISIWATLFRSSWQQLEKKFRFFWGMERFNKQILNKNELFQSNNYRNFIIGEKIFTLDKYYNLKNMISYLIIFLLVFMRLLIILILFYFMPKKNKLINIIINASIDSILIKIFSLFNYYICKRLIIWENHDTKIKQQNSLSLKLIIFELFNNFSSLFYIAFYKPYQSDIICYKHNCLIELESYLYILLLYNFIFNISETIIRYLKKVYVDKETETDPQNIRFQLKCIPKNNLIFEYTNKMIRYSFVIFFSVGAPLTPLFIFLMNFIENFIDIYKLIYIFRIENIDGSDGIGIYNTVFKTLYFLGMLCNIGLVLFTSPKFANLDLYLKTNITNNDDFIFKIVIFSIMENFMLIIMNLLDFDFQSIWMYHLNELKSLYDKKYYSRDSNNLPHLNLIES